MSRFGVMKHLGVLEDAGLVLVRRSGRHRYNHLNAVPLAEVYERWVRRHAQPTASSLLRLRDLVEQPSNPGNIMTTEPKNLAFHIEQEITLRADKAKVWKALTHDIAKWWGHHIGPKDSDISLDARVGGHFIERWGDGEGELYATVTFMRVGTKITLEGGMAMSGPGYSKFSYTLEESDGVTKLMLNHYCHGHRDPDVQASFAEGWKELLEGNLTAWIHDGKAAD